MKNISELSIKKSNKKFIDELLNDSNESPERESKKINSGDDLMTRAENIVWSIGLSGECAITVYRLLQTYEKLDAKYQAAVEKAAEKTTTEAAAEKNETKI